MSLCDHEKQLKQFMRKVIADDALHARWLNTLSYLENCGARKIAACEHPTKVKEEMLKHAAEEFRHAHYLKRQIEKVSSRPFQNYALSTLLGGFATLHYLDALDLFTVRYLREQKHVSSAQLKAAAYLLVTYAIELRAEKIYPMYHDLLKEAHSKVFVKSILLEEKEHLEEMRSELNQFPLGFCYAKEVCRYEEERYQLWLQAITND